jgi:hypothetical protein
VPRARPPAASRPGSPRWDPQAIEAQKIVVAEISKREHPPETIRISLIRRSGGYADVRVYRGGYPTRQGLVIHRELLSSVMAALQKIASQS